MRDAPHSFPRRLEISGEGGVHAYIETFLLHNLDDKLQADVRARASDKTFAKQVLKKNLSLDAEPAIARIMFHLIADTYSNIEKISAIDKSKLIVELGEKVKFADKANHSFNGTRGATA